MKTLIIIVLYVVQITVATDVIYSLDDATKYRMPDKYHLDRFQKCIGQPGGAYCTVWADLVADQPSDLLNMIKAYSAHDTKHFNYSNIKYGLCLTGSCRRLYDGDTTHEALWNTSEACLNESLARDYELKARVTDIDCYHHGHQYPPEPIDVAIGVVLIAILGLNFLGTVYDTFVRDKSVPGNEFLISFSIVANWNRLFAPPSDDPRQVRLRVMNGIRAITSILVILGHVPAPTANASVNPEHFEKTYDVLAHQILHQGHLITLTFFTMSGFLLSYNVELQAEKHQLNWRMLPKAIFARWLRLSPANLVTLMLTVIWFKFITVGPLFREFVMRESMDCRQYWLYNVFYATNLISHSQCNLQVWFLASDMQLHILGLAVLLLAPSKRARNWALAGLYLIGVGYPAYLVYSMDLHGTYLATPTKINEYFTTSDEFNLIFKPTIPNLPCFVIGMGFGYLVYYMQKNNLTNVSYRKYRLLYWACIVFMFMIPPLGAVFYQDGPRPGLLLRVLFAPVVKPLFGLAINLVIFGAFCRCDNLIRGILEWGGWVPITRLSYCMYLVHMLVLRYTGGSRDSLYYMSSHHMTQDYYGMVVMTMIFATLMHLLVEAPFGGLCKMFLAPKTSRSGPVADAEQKVTKAD